MQASFESLLSAPLKAPAFDAQTFLHVGVSGGKDSAAALLWAVHQSGFPRERILASWCDIGNDHEWTREHVALLNKTVHPIETIYPDLDFWELALHKKRFPSTKARFCTEHLKIYPTADHIQRLKFSGKRIIAVSGVRSDESDERAKLQEWDFSGNLFCYQWRPLIRWTIEDVFSIHKRHDVPLNPLYAIGALRVGCWPCIMSRKAEIRIIALNFPERIDEIRKAENAFETRYGRYSSFFPAASVPERFRTKPVQLADGTWIKVATIDDVVRWSMTGERAQGHYTDDNVKPQS